MAFSSSEVTASDQEVHGWQFAVAAGILGWVLDAFYCVIVVFLLGTLAANFHVSNAAIVFTLTLTLAMRSLGALLFGSLADRFGRRRPLIACVQFFSLVTALSGFAPNYSFFLVTRALYGIGMGSYWGIGASYAMESSPRSKRGILSGLMQGGYPLGYLLAPVAMLTVEPVFGRRSMFVVGSFVTVLIVILALLAPESTSWKLHHSPPMLGMFRALFGHAKIFCYMLLLMAGMKCLSHGTQDLYPDFLKSMPGMAGHSIFGMNMLYGIPVIYNIGAIGGALFFGHISEKVGRRRSIILALLLCLISIPSWAFGSTLLALILGSFFMQTGVQGAFGVIPAHLNELSPDAIRSLFPGFVYQLGVLIASPAASLEFVLRDRLGYPWALTAFECCVIVSLLLIFGFGPERLVRDFQVREESAGPASAAETATRVEGRATLSIVHAGAHKRT